MVWLFLAFVSVPLVEIALFIQIGGAIGLWPTLFVVIITAILGTFLVRTQGIMAMNNIRQSITGFQNPSEPLAHGAMILFSGALLLTPGFFTDAVGFLLLIPAVRRTVFRFAASRVQVQTFSTHPKPQAADEIIDGEYSEVDPAKTPPQQPSGWTKH